MITFIEFHEGEGSQAVRKKGYWKAVIRGVKTDNPQPLELYNLNDDLAEKNGVSEKFPGTAKEMRTLIMESHQPSGSFPLPGDKNAQK